MKKEILDYRARDINAKWVKNKLYVGTQPLAGYHITCLIAKGDKRKYAVFSEVLVNVYARFETEEEAVNECEKIVHIFICELTTNK